MVVDALMQIPWLSAIVSAVLWVAQHIAATVVAAWRMVVLFFTTYIPLLVAWGAQKVAHWVVVVALWVGILSVIWSLVLAFIEQLVEWTVPVESIAQFGGQWWYWMWHDPLQLSTAWAYVKRMPPVIMGVVSIRIVWRRLRWAQMTVK